MNVDWLSAVGMALAGLIVGFMFVYSMRRREGKSDLEMRDLEAKRDALLAALREGAESPEEKRRLEREAADVLRQIDERKKVKRPAGKRGAAAAEPEPEPSPVAVVPARGAAIKGFVWGAGSVAVVGAIVIFALQAAKPKDQQEGPAPMQQQQAQGQAQQPDPALQSIEQAVQKNPNDLGLRTELAKAYLDRENMMATYEQTQFILQRQPNDARALTYQAIVRIAMGQVDAAHQMLQTATKSDPDLLDAWVALAWGATIKGNDDEAQKAINEASKHHPDQKQRLDDLLTRMRAEQRATAAKLPANHPAVPGPGQTTSAAASAPAAGSSDTIHVTLQLAPNVKPAATAILFVMARPEGQAGGPPLAVKRVPLGMFPITIDLGPADIMMAGESFPAKVHVDARLDSDGNPMTHDPKDPSAAQDSVAAGSTITLTLK